MPGDAPPIFVAPSSAPKHPPLPAINPSGWSVARVHEEAGKIDDDNNGRISDGELAAFMNRARAAGMKDVSALAWYRKYETAAGLAAVQGRTPGRPFDDAYLGGPYKQQLGVVNASASDITQINKVLFPQIHTLLASGPLARMRVDAGLTAMDRTGVTAFYKSQGHTTAFVFDDNKDGLVDSQDFAVLDDQTSKALGQTLDADDINATAALIEFMRAYTANKPPFMPGNPRSQWLPQTYWQWVDNGPDAGYWKYKGSDAAKDVLDFLGNSKSYAGDCATLKQLAAHQALLHQVGGDRYNRLVAKYGLSIGFSLDCNQQGLSKEVMTNGLAPTSVADLEPNTMGYAAVSLGPPPPNATRWAEAAQAIKDGNWAGEHFLVWINTAGEKMIFAHPQGAVEIGKFESWLRNEVASVGSQVETLVEPKHVVLTYKDSQYYQAERARALAR